MLCIKHKLSVWESLDCESVYAGEFRGSGCDSIAHEEHCQDCDWACWRPSRSATAGHISSLENCFASVCDSILWLLWLCHLLVTGQNANTTLRSSTSGLRNHFGGVGSLRSTRVDDVYARCHYGPWYVGRWVVELSLKGRTQSLGLLTENKEYGIRNI